MRTVYPDEGDGSPTRATTPSETATVIDPPAPLYGRGGMSSAGGAVAGGAVTAGVVVGAAGSVSSVVGAAALVGGPTDGPGSVAGVRSTGSSSPIRSAPP